MNLDLISTNDLIKELSKRDNVTVSDIRPDGIQCILVDRKTIESIT